MFDRAMISISYLQNNERSKQRSCPRSMLSTNSRFDDPLPEEEHGESIRESSYIEHREAGSAESSLL